MTDRLESVREDGAVDGSADGGTSAADARPQIAPVRPVAPALGRQGASLAQRLLVTAAVPALTAGAAAWLLERWHAGTIEWIAALGVLGIGIAAFIAQQARSLARPLDAMRAHFGELARRLHEDAAPAGRSEVLALANALDAFTLALTRSAEQDRQRLRAEEQNGLDLQREYALMQMLRNLASVANQGESLEKALQGSLREIGEYLDWPIGRLVLMDARALNTAPKQQQHWYVRDQDRFAAFMEAAERAPFDAAGSGLIGRALETNLSHWISDVARLADWSEREAALACDLRTGFVIPIALGTGHSAFVEFFSDHRIDGGAEMLELVEAISVELWRTANRYQAEAAMRSTGTRARRLASIAECMKGAVAVVAPGGRIEWVNSGLTNLIGATAAQAIGKDIAAILFDSDEASAAEVRQHMASRTRVSGLILQSHRKDSPVRWFELEIQPMPENAGTDGGSFLIVRDITNERRTQGALTDALEVARQASHSKSQFLANMSHEIRTPMNGVLGMAELLLDTELDERQRRFIESLYRSGESLLDIINDILDFSKIEAGKLELESIDFDLRALVEDLIEMLAPRAHQKRIELACRLAGPLPGAVLGDPTRLRQVLVNVIGNAIKFTERGEVVLTVENVAQPAAGGASDGAQWVRFVVRDTGIGMRPEAVDRLFSVFMQADQSSSRRYGGTGLGLAISRQLTELMGGSISASSQIGEGSVFEIELPLRAGDAAAVPAGRGDAAGLQGKRVLIAEDNPTNRRILLEQLGALAMECATAENGRQALQMLRVAARSASPFDIAVIDMKMPIMDGMELAQSVRGDPALQNLRLVMLTSISGRDDARRAHALGVDAYLSKPVRQQDLVASLTEALVEAAEKETDEGSDNALAGQRILIVEDNPVNQEVVSAMLAGFGCEVRLAGDGLLALNLLERESFDLVLMDCQMPTMDGFEAVRRLRNPEYRQHDLTASRHLPVIALTANALAGDADRCRAAGFSDYLAKPFRQRVLRETLLRWTGARAALALPAAPAPARLPTIDGAPPAAVPVASDAEVLDVRVLGEIEVMERNGAKDLLRRLIATYEKSADGLMQAADRAFASAEAQAAMQALHTLKSSSANLGAMRFSRACAEIEALARQQKLDEAMQKWTAMRTEYARVIEALRGVHPVAGASVESRATAAAK